MGTYARVGISRREGTTIVAVDGEVDVANVSMVRSRVIGAVPNTSPGLILDLTKTSYLDSRAIHMILEIADRLATARQQLLVVAPEGGLIHRVLLLTHIDGFVPLHQTVDDALSQLLVRDDPPDRRLDWLPQRHSLGAHQKD